MIFSGLLGLFASYIGSVSASSAVSGNISLYDNAAYCTSYCDVYGYYQPAKWCVSQDPSVEVYCCGSQHDRYCCSDQGKDVGDLYSPVTDCPNSSWWHYQWKVIVGLLGTLVVMLMFAACCYFCCAGESRLPSRSRFLRRRRTRNNQGSSSAPQGEINSSFDPESPNAFTPPDYDSLPKDPPKYADIFSVDQGVAPLGSQSTGSDPTALPATALPEAPPEYTSTAAVLETVDTSNISNVDTNPSDHHNTPAAVMGTVDNSNITNMDTNPSDNHNNTITVLNQPCDVILLVPNVDLPSPSSSQNVNEPHVTSGSHLLSQNLADDSNARVEAINSDVQSPFVGDMQETRETDCANQTGPSDVISTGENEGSRIPSDGVIQTSFR